MSGMEFRMLHVRGFLNPSSPRGLNATVVIMECVEWDWRSVATLPNDWD
jgi:hypothetical protein